MNALDKMNVRRLGNQVKSVLDDLQTNYISEGRVDIELFKRAADDYLSSLVTVGAINQSEVVCGHFLNSYHIRDQRHVPKHKRRHKGVAVFDNSLFEEIQLGAVSWRRAKKSIKLFLKGQETVILTQFKIQPVTPQEYITINFLVKSQEELECQ